MTVGFHEAFGLLKGVASLLVSPKNENPFLEWDVEGSGSGERGPFESIPNADHCSAKEIMQTSNRYTGGPPDFLGIVSVLRLHPLLLDTTSCGIKATQLLLSEPSAPEGLLNQLADALHGDPFIGDPRTEIVNVMMGHVRCVRTNLTQGSGQMKDFGCSRGEFAKKDTIGYLWHIRAEGTADRLVCRLDEKRPYADGLKFRLPLKEPLFAKGITSRLRVWNGFADRVPMGINPLGVAPRKGSFLLIEK